MSTLETSIQTRDDPYPFDQPSADIILRTSDCVDFHVHSHILSQVSSVFATMFELPQPPAPPPRSDPSNLADIRPVIDVTEDSKALEPLLQLCYSASRCDLLDLHDIQPVLEAAIKYDMARPTEELTARFLACAPQSPLEVWAFGCRYGLEHVARGGAEALRKALQRGAGERLSYASCMDIPPSLRGLEGISAGQYFRLQQFVCCRGDLPGAATRTRDSSDSARTRPRGNSDGAFQFLRPPEIVATPHARTKRGAFVYITVAERERVKCPENPSVEVHQPDIVCRCKDGSEWWAHRQILSRHSSVLKARIATLASPPRPEGVSESARSHEPAPNMRPEFELELEGPSEAICTLLCICYQSPHDPRWSGLPRSRMGSIELLAVATKYQIKPAVDLAIARWKALARVHPPNTGTREAVMFRTRVAAAAATPAALGWCPPLRSRLDEYSGILEDLPASTYHRLFVYLDECMRAAAEALESATEAWELVAAERTQAAGELPDGDPEVVASAYQAIADALNRQREAVERQEVAPMADHARAIRWAAYSGETSRLVLVNRFKDLKNLLVRLPREIEDAIDKVKLDLG